MVHHSLLAVVWVTANQSAAKELEQADFYVYDWCRNNLTVNGVGPFSLKNLLNFTKLQWEDVSDYCRIPLHSEAFSLAVFVVSSVKTSISVCSVISTAVICWLTLSRWLFPICHVFVHWLAVLFLFDGDLSSSCLLEVCSWQKMTSVLFSVHFCQKNVFSFQFSFGFTKLAVVSVFWLVFALCVF